MKQFKPVVDNGINYVPYINDAGDAEGVCVQEGRMFKTTKMQFKFVPKTSQSPTSQSPDPSQSSQVAAGRRRTRINIKRMKKHRPKLTRHRRRTKKH